eukprot:gb/GFBE01062193.1/.p1 GENE.gb/GFBE01062193.1/~~gb/GFBE01062193.1/.p1  ORF type:complete len:115 (+),score=16.69 gb/GFBE01062193.1/:1-345(+)
MVKSNLTPNVITFNSLFGAHVNATVQHLKAVRAQMHSWDIQADKISVEIYLTVLFQKRLVNMHSPAEAARLIGSFDHDRLLEAAAVVKEARAVGLQLSGLSKQVERALRQMGML